MSKVETRKKIQSLKFNFNIIITDRKCILKYIYIINIKVFIYFGARWFYFKRRERKRNIARTHFRPRNRPLRPVLQFLIIYNTLLYMRTSYTSFCSKSSDGKSSLPRGCFSVRDILSLASPDESSDLPGPSGWLSPPATTTRGCPRSAWTARFGLQFFFRFYDICLFIN